MSHHFPARGASLVTRIATALAALVGLGAAAAVGAGQSVSPADAPVEWVRYAEEATKTISAWLGEEGDVATRFRAYLDQTRTAEDQPTPPLVLKVWIEPNGRIGRIEFPPFAHEAANADLRAAIVGRVLSPPPRDMRLPLRIAVQLDPAPAPASGTPATPARTPDANMT